MIGETGGVRAFLRAEPFSRGPVGVELREMPPTTDPRSGRPLLVPPVVVLWWEERPLAVRVRTIVALSTFPPNMRLAADAESGCLSAGLVVERMNEAALWRLFARPPRPWPAARR
jgi:hypothetical protein